MNQSLIHFTKFTFLKFLLVLYKEPNNYLFIGKDIIIFYNLIFILNSFIITIFILQLEIIYMYFAYILASSKFFFFHFFIDNNINKNIINF